MFKSILNSFSSLSFKFKFNKKLKHANMMYHCSQLAIAIRGEKWLDEQNEVLSYNTKQNTTILRIKY